jgi:hypothetical protein
LEGYIQRRKNYDEETGTIRPGGDAPGIHVAGAHYIPPTAYGRQGTTRVAIVADRASAIVKTPPAQWAIGQLQERLKSKGVAVEPLPLALSRRR